MSFGEIIVVILRVITIRAHNAEILMFKHVVLIVTTVFLLWLFYF